MSPAFLLYCGSHQLFYVWCAGVSIDTDGSSTISIDEPASSLLVVKGQEVVSRSLLQPEEPAQVAL